MKFNNVNQGAIHRPDFVSMSQDIIVIIDCYLSPEHSNGVACHWGDSLIRMALLFVQHSLPLKDLPNGQKSQDRVLIEGVSLGGQAVGSKYNTHVCYMPVMKGDREDDPLNDPRFPFYEGYFINYLINLMKTHKPIPTTKIRHDSSASFGEILLFVHEPKSGALEEEIMKVVIGLCRMLPYSKKPRGMVTTDHEIYWIQVELDEQHQCIVYHTQEELIFDCTNLSTRNLHAMNVRYS